MAEVIFNRAIQSKLGTVPIKDGSITYTRDTQSCYVDFNNSERKKITDIITYNTKTEFNNNQNNLLPDKLYIVSDDKSMYYNDATNGLILLSNYKSTYYNTSEEFVINDPSDSNFGQCNYSSIVPNDKLADIKVGSIIIDKYNSYGVIDTLPSSTTGKIKIRILYNNKATALFSTADFYIDTTNSDSTLENGSFDNPFSSWINLYNKCKASLENENIYVTIHIKSNSKVIFSNSLSNIKNVIITTEHGSQCTLPQTFSNCKITFLNILLTSDNTITLNNSTIDINNCQTLKSFTITSPDNSYINLYNSIFDNSDSGNNITLNGKINITIDNCSNIQLSGNIKGTVNNCSHIKLNDDINGNYESDDILFIFNTQIESVSSKSIKINKYQQIMFDSGVYYDYQVYGSNDITSTKTTNIKELKNKNTITIVANYISLGTFDFKNATLNTTGFIISDFGLNSLQVHDNIKNRAYGEPNDITLKAHLDKIGENSQYQQEEIDELNGKLNDLKTYVSTSIFNVISLTKDTVDNSYTMNLQYDDDDFVNAESFNDINNKIIAINLGEHQISEENVENAYKLKLTIPKITKKVTTSGGSTHTEPITLIIQRPIPSSYHADYDASTNYKGYTDLFYPGELSKHQILELAFVRYNNQDSIVLVNTITPPKQTVEFKDNNTDNVSYVTPWGVRKAKETIPLMLWIYGSKGNLQHDIFTGTYFYDENTQTYNSDKQIGFSYNGIIYGYVLRFKSGNKIQIQYSDHPFGKIEPYGILENQAWGQHNYLRYLTEKGTFVDTEPVIDNPSSHKGLEYAHIINGNLSYRFNIGYLVITLDEDTKNVTYDTSYFFDIGNEIREPIGLDTAEVLSAFRLVQETIDENPYITTKVFPLKLINSVNSVTDPKATEHKDTLEIEIPDIISWNDLNDKMIALDTGNYTISNWSEEKGGSLYLQIKSSENLSPKIIHRNYVNMGEANITDINSGTIFYNGEITTNQILQLSIHNGMLYLVNINQLAKSKKIYDRHDRSTSDIINDNNTFVTPNYLNQFFTTNIKGSFLNPYYYKDTSKVLDNVNNLYDGWYRFNIPYSGEDVEPGSFEEFLSTIGLNRQYMNFTVFVTSSYCNESTNDFIARFAFYNNEVFIGISKYFEESWTEATVTWSRFSLSEDTINEYIQNYYNKTLHEQILNEIQTQINNSYNNLNELIDQSVNNIVSNKYVSVTTYNSDYQKQLGKDNNQDSQISDLIEELNNLKNSMPSGGGSSSSLDDIYRWEEVLTLAEFETNYSYAVSWSERNGYYGFTIPSGDYSNYITVNAELTVAGKNGHTIDGQTEINLILVDGLNVYIDPITKFKEYACQLVGKIVSNSNTDILIKNLHLQSSITKPTDDSLIVFGKKEVKGTYIYPEITFNNFKNYFRISYNATYQEVKIGNTLQYKCTIDITNIEYINSKYTNWEIEYDDHIEYIANSLQDIFVLIDHINQSNGSNMSYTNNKLNLNIEVYELGQLPPECITLGIVNKNECEMLMVYPTLTPENLDEYGIVIYYDFVRFYMDGPIDNDPRSILELKNVSAQNTSDIYDWNIISPINIYLSGNDDCSGQRVALIISQITQNRNSVSINCRCGNPNQLDPGEYIVDTWYNPEPYIKTITQSNISELIEVKSPLEMQYDIHYIANNNIKVTFKGWHMYKKDNNYNITYPISLTVTTNSLNNIRNQRIQITNIYQDGYNIRLELGLGTNSNYYTIYSSINTLIHSSLDDTLSNLTLSFTYESLLDINCYTADDPYTTFGDFKELDHSLNGHSVSIDSDNFYTYGFKYDGKLLPRVYINDAVATYDGDKYKLSLGCLLAMGNQIPNNRIGNQLGYFVEKNHINDTITIDNFLDYFSIDANTINWNRSYNSLSCTISDVYGYMNNPDLIDDFVIYLDHESYMISYQVVTDNTTLNSATLYITSVRQYDNFIMVNLDFCENIVVPYNAKIVGQYS